MGLKLKLNEEERFGLTKDEILQAERYLRRNKTAGALKDHEAMLLYELFMLGTSFKDMSEQYPQYPLGQIILTCALRKWPLDRDRIMSSLKERVKARMVKSVVDSVNFLTTMLSVANLENVAQMEKYLKDPRAINKPDMRIKSIKEYKEILDALQKLMDSTAGSSSKGKNSTLYGSLDTTVKIASSNQKKIESRKEASALLAEVVEAEDEE